MIIITIIISIIIIMKVRNIYFSVKFVCKICVEKSRA